MRPKTRLLGTLAVILPFGVAAFFLTGAAQSACLLAMPVIMSLGLLWGLWRRDQPPHTVLATVPFLGVIILQTHSSSLLPMSEKYVAATLLASMTTFALDQLQRRRS